MEKTVVERSTGIITVSDVMKQQIVDRYPGKGNKIEVIENGFDTDDFTAKSIKIDKEIFSISHLGNLYSWRSPENLYKAIILLKERELELYNRIKVTFIGTMPENYKRLAVEFGLSGKIIFYNRVPYSDSLDMIKNTHLGLIIQGKLQNIENMLTAKLFDYLGLKIPVLSLSGSGDLKKFVENESIGLNCDPDSPVDIAEKLIRIYKEYESFTGQISTQDMHRYTRKHLTKKLSGILDKYTIAG